MNKSGFVGGNLDQSLYVKSENGMVYVALHIDNNLMIGDIKAINGFNAENRLVLKIMEGLQDYLSCEVKFSIDRKRAWLGQPHLIKNLVKKFDDHVKNIYTHKTPGMPKFSNC